MLPLILTALAAAARPAPCVHELDERRPRLTLAEQAETRRTLRIAVAELGGSRDFAALLELVAARESSLQRGVVHRLGADLDANAAAWRKLRASYEGNPHIGDASRWQGYGLFGMNAAIFTRVWDPQADPRDLCDPLVDVLVYQRAATRVLAKLERTGKCAPTWANIHAAVSGGKLCPTGGSARFRRRAARAGLDPDRAVTAVDLGQAPSLDTQRAVLARLRLALNMRRPEAS